METSNQTYNKIMKYIQENANVLSSDDLNFLLGYARNIRINNIENVKQVSKQQLLTDLKVLNDKLREGDKTSVVLERLCKELELLDKCYMMSDEDSEAAKEHDKNIYDLEKEKSFPLLGNKDGLGYDFFSMDDISYQIDRLYYECGMDVRKDSTLVYKLIGAKDYVIERNKIYK